MTLALGVTAIGIGTALVAGIALMRLYAPKPLRLCAVLYTDLMRAMPVLVVLILIYYALPFAGIVLSSLAAAAIALSLVLGAYTAEVMRAGIQAVPKGQFEAAAALGIHFWLAMRKVVLPQAMRIVIPPHASNCVSIIKDTLLASVVAMTDLLKQAAGAADRSNASSVPINGKTHARQLFPLPLHRPISRQGRGSGPRHGRIRNRLGRAR